MTIILYKYLTGKCAMAIEMDTPTKSNETFTFYYSVITEEEYINRLSIFDDLGENCINKTIIEANNYTAVKIQEKYIKR